MCNVNLPLESLNQLLKPALKSVGYFKRSKRTDIGSDFILYYAKIMLL